MDNALSPLQAHAAIERFAASRGEGALRLAMHAALPQSIRIELLHALRLNFALETLGDAAVEADVVFAPFSRALGNACWEFDAEVRMQLLRLLDPAHPDEAPPRSAQVADFLLTWLDRERRHARADRDLVYRSWIEVERWNALAFADAEAAAEQLAAAAQQMVGAGEAAARLRVGTLAESLAVPLLGHRRLIAYAKGVEALDRGDARRAQQLLDDVGVRPIVAGTRTVEPRAAMRAARASARAAKPPVPAAAAAPARCIALIVHAHADGAWAERLLRHVEREAARAGRDDAEVLQLDELAAPTLPDDAHIDARLAGVQVVVALLSPHYVESGALARVDARLIQLHRRGALRLLWTSLRRCAWDRTPYAGLQWVHSANEPLAELKAADAERRLDEIALAVVRVWKSPPVAGAEALRPKPGGGVYVACLAEEAGDLARRLVTALRETPVVVHDDVDADRMPRATLDAAAARCEAMLALIGPRSVEAAAADSAAQRPLAPQAARVADALRRGAATVVPVLLEDTPMPRWPDLPEALKPLLSLQALDLRSRRWDDDLKNLLARVQAAVAPAAARTTASSPHRAMLLLDDRHHSGVFDTLASALRRAGCEPVIPDGALAEVRTQSMIVAELRRVDFLVLDLSLPEGLLVAWASGVAEAGVPLVPIRAQAHPARDAWAAHLLEPRRAAWVAPTVTFANPEELAVRVADDVVAAAAAVAARPKSVTSVAEGATEIPEAQAGLRIALCSTLADLVPFRDAVREVAERWQDRLLVPGNLDDAGPLQQALAQIAECHVAVFIVAWRYGFVPSDPQLNPQGLSATELQYREAMRLGKPRLVLVLEDVGDWPSKWHDASTDPVAARNVERFRRDLADDPAMRPIRDVEQLRKQLDAFLAIRTHRPIEAPPKAKFRRRDAAGPAAGRVLLFVGHTIDAPGHTPPSFPAASENAMARAIREAVAAELEKGDVAFALSSASDGGDILFLEACRNLELPMRIYLPVPDRTFVKVYLAPKGEGWVERYQRVAQRGPVVVLADDSKEDMGTGHMPSRDRWQRNSDAMLDAALAHGADQVTLIALWNGEPNGPAGGPSYLLSRAQTLGIRRVVIDPKSRALGVVAAGSALVVFDRGVEAAQQDAIVHNLLLAQLAARNKAGTDSSPSAAWTSAYFDVLSSIGWSTRTRQFGSDAGAGSILNSRTLMLDLLQRWGIIELGPAVEGALDRLHSGMAALTFPEQGLEQGAAQCQLVVVTRSNDGVLTVRHLALSLRTTKEPTWSLLTEGWAAGAEVRWQGDEFVPDTVVLESTRDTAARRVEPYVEDMVRMLPDDPHDSATHQQPL